jgi:hypothetical protein
MRKNDLRGRWYGRLLVERQGPHSRAGKVQWVCLCRCGARATVDAHSLRSGNTTSCGCQRRDALGKHFMTHTPEYRAWRGAKRRCSARKGVAYPNYGGRGIRMAPEWQRDFAAFFAHVGERPSELHSLDRIDVNGDYTPGNVRWATKQEQANNRRTNTRLTVPGLEHKTVAWIAQAMEIDWKVAKRMYAK